VASNTERCNVLLALARIGNCWRTVWFGGDVSNCRVTLRRLGCNDLYVTQQLDTSSPKQTVRQQLQWPTISYPCQGKNCIPSFSIESHLHQSLKTNSMLPERIRLFFTNFSLVNVSQHKANSITIFRYNTTQDTISINTTLPPFYWFLCVSVDHHFVLNQFAASMTL